MSSLPWIKVYTDVLDHPKSLRLASRLSDPRAPFYMFATWCYAGRLAPDGKFPDAATVEAAARWTGEPGVLADALVAVGFLDKRGRGGALVIHNWEDHQAAHVERRAKDRAYQRAKRAERRKERRADVVPTSASPSLSPSPSPSPSQCVDRSQASNETNDDPGHGNLPAPRSAPPPRPAPAQQRPVAPAIERKPSPSPQATGDEWGLEAEWKAREMARHLRVLEALTDEPRLTLDIAKQLGRSHDTVHTDLLALKKQGRAEKVEDANGLWHWRRVSARSAA